jgi:hypothetical protein
MLPSATGLNASSCNQDLSFVHPGRLRAAGLASLGRSRWVATVPYLGAPTGRRFKKRLRPDSRIYDVFGCAGLDVRRVAIDECPLGASLSGDRQRLLETDRTDWR